jgi:hypothetical protein
MAGIWICRAARREPNVAGGGRPVSLLDLQHANQPDAPNKTPDSWFTAPGAAKVETASSPSPQRRELIHIMPTAGEALQG